MSDLPDYLEEAQKLSNVLNKTGKFTTVEFLHGHDHASVPQVYVLGRLPDGKARAFTGVIAALLDDGLERIKPKDPEEFFEFRVAQEFFPPRVHGGKVRSGWSVSLKTKNLTAAVNELCLVLEESMHSADTPATVTIAEKPEGRDTFPEEVPLLGSTPPQSKGQGVRGARPVLGGGR